MGLDYISKFQVFIDCLFYQKLDWHKEVFWQTCLQEETQTMVKCSLNHSRKKYGVLNYNGNAEKKKYLLHSNSEEHVQSELMQF